ncbi:MAG: NAD(P)-dependent oxidoreductase [Planctomycetota bacterium]|jgi:phosphoglycerate dehydrogenase-like enzyme
MKINIWLTHTSVDCWRFSEENAAYLKEKIRDAEVVVSKDAAEFKSNLSDTDIAVVWVFKQDWFELAPYLKWIITPAAGRDYFNITMPENIELDYCTFHGELMGETAMAMMLAECRGVSHCARTTTIWPRGEVSAKMRPLRNSHLVIFGFGNIGTWIARYAKPFGVKITGIKRSESPVPDFFEDGDSIVTIDKMDSILPAADHLFVALPSGKETTDIINRERLKLLKESAVIYNIGRGNAIDEDALFEALNAGDLAAAYLDVFKEEPLSEASPLRKLPNFYMMPHASAIAPNYLTLFIDEFVEKYKKKGF